MICAFLRRLINGFTLHWCKGKRNQQIWLSLLALPLPFWVTLGKFHYVFSPSLLICKSGWLGDLWNPSHSCCAIFTFFVVVQPLSHVWLFVTHGCSMPGFSVLHYLQRFLQLMSIESVMLSNHLIICCPFSFCFQSFPASESFGMEIIH